MSSWFRAVAISSVALLAACSGGGSPGSQPETLQALPGATPAGVRSATSPPPLVVGPGRQYATIAAAVAAAHNGDTIDVVSGTYYNDFSTITHNVTIQGVGGMVKLVATQAPPNEKGAFDVEPPSGSLRLINFQVSGVAIPSSEGNNGAGIRGNNGAIVVQYCYFYDNQDGILAPGSSTVAVYYSEFRHNGAGDGYSHNLYIGPAVSFLFYRSYSRDAVVGHDLKSRAARTTIESSTLADDPTADSSYEIDIPNAGSATIENSYIEKGPLAQNSSAVHYGGETNYHWNVNGLTLTGNTVVNNFGPNAVAVLNQSAINGLTVVAQLASNDVYGFAAGNVVSGPANVAPSNVIDPKASDAPPIPTVRPFLLGPIIPIPKKT